ncbi:GATOR complex protein DEPDC5 isoform X2 [Tetranychus urticae]|uniref:GATOR complex protein DEPDC5 isoform X2 n=1 Tax=Tetranychus urticae TaxID=32264 RepID=UPI00077C0033|nr:GATOR complex protein DEPDC5 isoform X2 [Tetranychus urticae]
MERIYKLQIHSNQNKEELLISHKDAADFKIDDILEIYSDEISYSHLLLCVKGYLDPKDVKSKDKPCISVEQSIASSFHLRPYLDVKVRKVNPKDVTLDSVELTFKDQYLSRSDMWRLKCHLVKTCIYLNKTVTFSGIRCTVFEMWSQGERVASGYLSSDTKIVFRSASSMVYLFIQMSSEMWDYDINGDLYFEKAINGFLYDLFAKWKRFNCAHDVTIVLFSRTFYKAKSTDEFPPEMRGCLQQDYKNRFYEDFYRVAVQNDRLDDWEPVLVLLKKLFNQYEKEVLRYHEKPGVKIPKAFNSTSSQGNFLEVLNMSLNVFEKHYLDRSFDRTGQLSVVISPGVGVFEVDFELSNITKQRIIDNGIGSDLVCLGEQPLHAVPLFKFNRGNSSPYPLTAADLFNMPHWINLSFYSSTNNHFCSSYVPRIKMPNILPKSEKPNWNNKPNLYRSPSRDLTSNDSANNFCPIMSVLDYDQYDEKVFKAQSHLPSVNSTCQPSTRRKSTMGSHFHLAEYLETDRNNQRRASDALAFGMESNTSSNSNSMSSAMSIPAKNNSQSASSHGTLSTSVESKTNKALRLKLESKDDLTLHRYNSSTLPYRDRTAASRPKALINPFDPSHVSIKLTSNRRRWTHVFPLGPTGIFMQQHHYQAVPQNTASTLLPLPACNRKSRNSNSESNNETGDLGTHQQPKHPRSDSYSSAGRSLSPSGESPHSLESTRSKRVGSRTASIISADPHTDKSLTWAWGATGEQEWTPAITTGVDWKSLVIPACLPLTTDFIPDNRSLDNDYVNSEYSLLPESIIPVNDYSRPGDGDLDNKLSRSPLTTTQVFKELICQRLQMGFQTIVYPKDNVPNSMILNHDGDPYDQTLSIGRIFHRLKLENSMVYVRVYRPRHPYPVKKINYPYQFRAPDNETYGVSWAGFASEKLETYTWSYLDNYVCARGENEYELKDDLKYWRLRILILPKRESITRKVIDSLYEADNSDPTCELYPDWDIEEKYQLQEGFLKFVEIINNIRRNVTSGRRIISDTHKNTESKRRSGMNISDLMDKADQEDYIETTPTKKLSTNMSYKTLVEKLKNSSNVYYFGKDLGLPEFTFISAEAVSWAIESIDGVFNEESACDLFQEMINSKLICHASGYNAIQFEHGFYFYFIVDKSNEKLIDDDESKYELFNRTWFEVKLLPARVSGQSEWSKPPSEIIKLKKSIMKFNRAVIDLDSTSEDGRVEWMHAKYQAAYHPDYSYEMELQWMVATSYQLVEKVQQWARKTGAGGFHFVPIPNDPFALPFESKSDPLRGPIFIQLNLDELPPKARQYLQGDNLINFRKDILKRFGFLTFSESGQDQRQQFIHVSGSIFVLLPDTSSSDTKVQKGSSKNEDICSPHEEYITRHFSGVKQTDRNGLEDIRNGFLWAWNYMITKRWKSNVTGDETYMRRFMRNFRRFCLNTGGRLVAFWNEYSKNEIKDASLVIESSV